MCGEHAWAFSLTSSKSGSSPHVRGARGFMLSEAVHCGIIPACAGSTPQMAHSISITWDHPRMCGEHIVKHVRPCSKRGSSPHVRGAHCETCPSVFETGIIPACAGSTHSKPTTRSSIRDHPRMCGEHVVSEHLHGHVQGSSPHVRGARHAIFVEFELDGIIPACAGSTPRHGSSPACRRDHPRMCGEHNR